MGAEPKRPAPASSSTGVLSPGHKGVWAVLVLTCLMFAWWNVTSHRRLAELEAERLKGRSPHHMISEESHLRLSDDPLERVRKVVTLVAPVIWCWVAAVLLVRTWATTRGQAFRAGMTWMAALTLTCAGAALLNRRLLHPTYITVWLASLPPGLLVTAVSDGRRARRLATETMLAIAMLFFTALIVEPDYYRFRSWVAVGYGNGDDWLAGAYLLAFSVLAAVIVAPPPSLRSLRHFGQFGLGKLMAFVTVAGVLLALGEVGFFLAALGF